MASSQPPQTEQSGSKPAAPRPRRNHLFWPAAAVALGALLIHQSLDSPVEGLPNRTSVRTTYIPYAQSLAPTTPTTPTTPAAPTAPAVAAPDDKGLSRSVPTRISIPDIGVNAPFTKLSLSPSGQLQAPPIDDDNLVGWFEGGVSPGERGSSIVVGHVDTEEGPAVFAQLETLEPGQFVDITRTDGVVARFKVDSVDTFSKANFPDKKVYADTPGPELRLITCGGAYDRTKKDYVDNVVVFAHLDSVTDK
ncbi:class F sortase [Streptomyces sp. NPDC046831]|uniref:class F sortase n=1 Tax=Streptomyces sp. NPDC046831 TaxID=3154805 RepID=UPI0033E3A561